MSKVNAKNKVTAEDLAKRGNGGKEQVVLDLAEHEKVQVAILLEKVNILRAQLDQVSQALSELIRSIVGIRGLDTDKFGVNLAAGKILPVEPVKSDKVESPNS